MLQALASTSSSGSHTKVRRGSRPATSASHLGLLVAFRSSCHLRGAGRGGRPGASAAAGARHAARAVPQGADANQP